MVSVENSTDVLVHDIERALGRRLQESAQPDLVRLFSHWLSFCPESVTIGKILTSTSHRDGALQDYKAIAVLSYGLACGLLGDEEVTHLRSGLERLIGRSPFVDDVPMAFCSDTVAILGFALAVSSLSDDDLKSALSNWLRSFVPKMFAMDGTDDWQRCIWCAADVVLKHALTLPDPVPSSCPEAFLVLAKRRLFDLPVADSDALRIKVIRSALAAKPAEMAIERVLLLSAALAEVKEGAPVALPGRMSADSIIQLLERFTAGLRNWTWETKARTSATQPTKWNVDHEYHVQNMLWFLLSPIFPDLDDEQYLTKIGQKNPRADLYIPSMKIMIEAKFLRKGKPFQGIIDEISSDASLYSAMGNEFAGLIVFVWDNSGRNQEHDYLKNGLSKLSGVLGTIVVSRPADWGADATSGESAVPATESAASTLN